MPNSPKTSDIDVESFLCKNEKLDKERDAPHIDEGRATRRGFNFQGKPHARSIMETLDPQYLITPEMLGFSENKGNEQEADMSNISKTELEALLRANKSEVDVVAAGMREDMAKWREQQSTQMSQLNATLTVMSAKMDSQLEVFNSAIGGIDKSLNAKIDSIDKSLNAKIDGINGSLGGKIEGINTAISGIQSGISIKLTIFSVVIAGIIAMSGWWLSSSQPQQAPVSQQPTVIYVQPPLVPFQNDDQLPEKQPVHIEEAPPLPEDAPAPKQ
ncbi:MAG TPA: hypothetical protein DIT05_12500 [Morganella sp. (in: Bacteria)]|nr:hypothetical protein [Morganella sp. (in: enterobacteria)]